jgi:hypothetical protein
VFAVRVLYNKQPLQLPGASEGEQAPMEGPLHRAVPGDPTVLSVVIGKSCDNSAASKHSAACSPCQGILYATINHFLSVLSIGCRLRECASASLLFCHM